MNDILAAYPEYAETSSLDALRGTEYGYLDEKRHVYLDYTGAGLAARSQLRRAVRLPGAEQLQRRAAPARADDRDKFPRSDSQ